MSTDELKIITDVIVKSVEPSKLGDALFSIMKLSKQMEIQNNDIGVINHKNLFFTK